MGRSDRIALTFDREARTADEAVRCALQDVTTAIPGATLVEASPDFVGLTEVADMIGVTRQNLRKLSLAHADSFPAPVHEGSASIWHLAPLLEWFVRHQDYDIARPMLDVAQVTMQLNVVKQAALESLVRMGTAVDRPQLGSDSLVYGRKCRPMTAATGARKVESQSLFQFRYEPGAV